MITPGLYELCFRGLTLREAWRFAGGPLKFGVALGLKLRDLRGPRLRLPAHECEAECPESEHSEAARKALAPLVDELKKAGYEAPQRIRQVVNHDPTFREAAGVVALHSDHQRCIQAAYLRNENAGVERVALTTTGILLDAVEQRFYEFVGHNHYFDADDVVERFRVPPANVPATDEAMRGFLAKHPGRCRKVGSLREFRQIGFSLDDLVWQEHVARGLYVRLDQP